MPLFQLTGLGMEGQAPEYFLYLTCIILFLVFPFTLFLLPLPSPHPPPPLSAGHGLYFYLIDKKCLSTFYLQNPVVGKLILSYQLTLLRTINLAYLGSASGKETLAEEKRIE